MTRRDNKSFIMPKIYDLSYVQAVMHDLLVDMDCFHCQRQKGLSYTNRYDRYGSKDGQWHDDIWYVLS